MSYLPHANSFRDLVAYQKARALAKEIFKLRKCEEIGRLLSFALIIGNSASLILGCHSGGILFQSSTVLNNKQDASSMTSSFYFCKHQ